MKKSPYYFIRSAVVMMVILFYCITSQAATYINHTRIIINEKEHEAVFDIVNEGAKPVLMQLWSDRGNVLDNPETIKMPFIILPPVFRLDGKTTRTVRLQLIAKGNTLPTDKESLFWLNALEIPTKATTEGSDSALQLAFRTRIKILYRPASLANVALAEIIKNLQIVPVNCGNHACLRIKNTSPLHVSLLDITLSNDKVITDLPEEGIIAPLSFVDIPLEKVNTLDIKALSWIDDFGVINAYRRP